MELTEQISNDIDELFRFSIKHGFREPFGIGYYQRTARPDVELQYIYYLAGLVKHSMEKYKRNWISVDGNTITCNNNTVAFQETGGFKRLYEDEKRQEMKDKLDLELASKTLRDYKSTRRMARIGFGIALALAVFELVKFFIERKIFRT
jgi:hypothetical protein